MNSIDLTGQHFGMLTVVERVADSPKGYDRWLCKCDCGEYIEALGIYLKCGRTTSCSKHTPPRVDLTGKRYGKLTVLHKDSCNSRGEVRWLCKCDCGNEVVVETAYLNKGRKSSCGCAQKEHRQQIQHQLHIEDDTCIERLGRTKGSGNTGIAGVHRTKDGYYTVTIGFQRKRYYLGAYKTLEQAVEAREKGLELHYEYLDKYYVKHPEGSQEA